MKKKLPIIIIGLALLGYCAGGDDLGNVSDSNQVVETTRVAENTVTRGVYESEEDTYDYGNVVSDLLQPIPEETTASNTQHTSETVNISSDSTSSQAETQTSQPEEVVEVAPVVVETPTQTARTYTFVLNTNSMKAHLPTCGSVSQIRDYNRSNYTGTIEQLIQAGYDPCGRCHPW